MEAPGASSLGGVAQYLAGGNERAEQYNMI